ncbi:MAG: class I SAM-dependent methyltransferase [Chloroherpetonaceae bacterium]|nr:class I SAM-dependent methyltransferase [Chloroherpetonaceae bacterium]MDW8438327.1 class I SAM-dependent methyltransferase [Chloroherpetonaceae bacterium]
MSYADRLFKEGSALTRFSHRARAQKALDLLRSTGREKFDNVVDYGCADGWFLKALYDENLSQRGMGIDINEEDLARSRRLFAEIPSFQFIKTTDLSSDHFGKFDLVVSMETLEHVADAKVALAHLQQLCAPDAVALFSVPIEIGPSLLMKLVGRFVTGLFDKTYRHFNDEETYSLGEIIEAGVFWKTQNLKCSHNLPNVYYRGHKGFDYRKLRALVLERFDILATEHSPFPIAKQFLNSTIYWLCKPKAQPRVTGDNPTPT